MSEEEDFWGHKIRTKSAEEVSNLKEDDKYFEEEAGKGLEEAVPENGEDEGSSKEEGFSTPFNHDDTKQANIPTPSKEISDLSSPDSANYVAVPNQLNIGTNLHKAELSDYSDDFFDSDSSSDSATNRKTPDIKPDKNDFGKSSRTTVKKRINVKGTLSVSQKLRKKGDSGNGDTRSGETLETLRKENERLRRLQMRQTKLNMAAADERVSEELRIMKEQMRQYRDKLRRQDLILRERNALLQKTIDSKKQLDTRLKQLHPGTALKKTVKNPEEKSTELQHHIESQNTRIQNLERKILLMEKNHRHQLNIEVSRHKNTQEKLRVLQEQTKYFKVRHGGLDGKFLPEYPHSTKSKSKKQPLGGSQITRDTRINNRRSKKILDAYSIGANTSVPNKLNVGKKPLHIANDETGIQPKTIRPTSLTPEDSVSLVEEHSPSLTSPDDSGPQRDGIPALDMIHTNNDHSSMPSFSPELPKQKASGGEIRTSGTQLIGDIRETDSGFESGTQQSKRKPGRNNLEDVHVDVGPGKQGNTFERISFEAEENPFDSFKPQRKETNRNTGASSVLDQLFGPKPQRGQRKSSSPKLRTGNGAFDFDNDDLFPSLVKKQQNGSVGGGTKPLVDNGLFPWEKATLKATKVDRVRPSASQNNGHVSFAPH